MNPRQTRTFLKVKCKTCNSEHSIALNPVNNKFYDCHCGTTIDLYNEHNQFIKNEYITKEFSLPVQSKKLYYSDARKFVNNIRTSIDKDNELIERSKDVTNDKDKIMIPLQPGTARENTGSITDKEKHIVMDRTSESEGTSAAESLPRAEGAVETEGKEIEK